MKSLSVLGIFVADLAFFGKIPTKGETVLGDDFVVGPGGKGSNQAVAAGKAGADVSFISKIGNDNYGQMAKKIYSETNVKTENLFVTEDKSTGVAAILLNKETGDNAISVVPGAAGALTIEDIDKAEEEIKNASFFLTQLETPLETTIHALKVAKRNAKDHGVLNRIKFFRGDLFPEGDSFPEKFDFILSNPPYIGSKEFDSLEPEITGFEPKIALISGETGFEAYTRIISKTLLRLNYGGYLIMEIGDGQLEQVESLIDQSGGFGKVSKVFDYSGKPRTISVRKSLNG